jgi:hypothetical protein
LNKYIELLSTDESGIVYITGDFSDNIDFDPIAGDYSLMSTN